MAARRAALRLVHHVLVHGRSLDSGLDRALAGLDPRDRALARALVSAVLRHLPALDGLIDSACARPLAPDARARLALRVGLAGRLVLGQAPHAVVATTLPLLEGGPRRLAHGVMGTLFRQGVALAPPRLPDPWPDRWTAAWGAVEVAAAARAFGTIAPTDLRLAAPGDTREWADRLGAVSLYPGHLRLQGSHDVAALPGYEQGAWWVQDAAAALPALLLGGVGGLRVLDLCAAPGGKTMQLAAAGARVTAVDQSARRLALLRWNLARTGLAAELVTADVLQWAPDQPFDAILLDAPCSATGTFRRHPDVLHLRDGTGLAALASAQRAMLERASGWLRPGGRLVYAVCSLEREEGEGVVEAPLAGLLPEPIGRQELPTGVMPVGSTVRTLPSVWGEDGGGDGFFIARWRRPG